MSSKTTDRLNVLFVVPWDQESGGVANVAAALARHLHSAGHGVLFVNPGSDERPRHKTTKAGFAGVELRLRPPYDSNRPLRSAVAFVLMFPFTLWQLIAIIRSNAIRIVNIHYPGEHCVYLAFCRWLLPVRLVVSIHGMDAIRWDSPLQTSWPLRLLFRAADLIVAPSWRFLRRCDQVLGSVPARRLAIHNGTDLAELELLISGDQRFVLSVCSLDEWKGVDVLIRAVAILRDRGQRLTLLIAGDGPSRSSLEKLIVSLNLEDQVTLLGWQSRSSVVRLLQECTLFVLASRFETFGLALVEAMACGKAVIGTRVDGILEIVRDRENGILVDAGDADALAAAIEVVNGDGALRQRLGDAARERVRREFREHHMTEAYASAFREVLASGV